VSDLEPWLGIPSDQVVAVVASLSNGMIQFGSGYLLTRNCVITARHCTFDKKTGDPAAALQVIRRSDGAQAPARVFSAALDIAVLEVDEASSLPVTTEPLPPVFGHVDVTHSGELFGCTAVGFPLWQFDPEQRHRDAAELHGTIRATEGAESGVLVMRDPLLLDVAVPESVAQEDRGPDSPWGGLSGALVFQAGMALGVIVEHRPRQGHSALTVLPIQRIAALAVEGDPDAAKVATTLALPVSGQLPLAGIALSADSAALRVTVGVEAENYVRQGGPQDRLSWIIVNTLRAAGISPDRCERQDEGDGRQLITLPATIPVESTLPAILRAAPLVASQANSLNSTGRMRILMTFAQGPVHMTAGGYAGPGVSAVSSMLRSESLREALREQRQADLAAMISGDLYLQLYSQASGRFDPEEFRTINVAASGAPYTSQCWLFTPAGTSDANRTTVFTGLSADLRTVLSTAIPLAGMGAIAWRESSEHNDREPDQHEPLGHQHETHDPWSAHPHTTHGPHYDQVIHHAGPGDPGFPSSDDSVYQDLSTVDPNAPGDLSDSGGIGGW
jgi:hypothetical protein